MHKPEYTSRSNKKMHIPSSQIQQTKNDNPQKKCITLTKQQGNIIQDRTKNASTCFTNPNSTNEN